METTGKLGNILENIFRKTKEILLIPINAIVALFVGTSENQFITPVKRLKLHKSFIEKLRKYWNDQRSVVKFYPIEVEEGIDFIVYSMVKRILEAKPVKVNYCRGMINGYDEDNNLVIYKTMPRVLTAWIGLFENADPYNMEVNLLKSLRRYLGVTDQFELVGQKSEIYTWTINGLSDEEKIVSKLKRVVRKGIMIELNPDWCVALIDENLEHIPGMDRYWHSFMSFYPNRVDRDKLVKMLDDSFGEHQVFDRIMAGFTWRVT